MGGRLRVKGEPCQVWPCVCAELNKILRTNHGLRKAEEGLEYKPNLTSSFFCVPGSRCIRALQSFVEGPLFNLSFWFSVADVSRRTGKKGNYSYSHGHNRAGLVLGRISVHPSPVCSVVRSIH